MDELKSMRTFVCVADAGSFAGAARTLNVAPAAVTRAIADLEQHLGTRLMMRTTRRNVLTDIGAGYLERVRHIVHEADAAAALVRQSHHEARGAVRVLAPPGFVTHQLAARLPRFHREHPRVTVDVTANGPVESLDERHDITIVVRQPELDGAFVARRLARSTVIACATPEYLDRHGRPSHPRQLAGHPLLVPPLPRELTFSHADAGESITVAATRTLLNSTNQDLHQAGALAGIGIAGLASFAAERALRERQLEQVLPGWQLSQLSIWACMPTRQHVPASTRAFMDFLLAEFGGRDTDPWIPRRGTALRAPVFTLSSSEPSPCH